MAGVARARGKFGRFAAKDAQAAESVRQVLHRRVEVAVFDHHGVRRTRQSFSVAEAETLNVTVAGDYCGASVSAVKNEDPAAAA